MEMEEGGPSTRKRKFVALETHQQGAAEVGRADDPRPTATTEDRISNLPDTILGEIVSLLPTKEGARTRILASKWRDLWLSAPLNLDCHRLTADSDLLAGVVSHILSSHPAPGRRFSAGDYHLLGVPAATIDAWLLSPALNNLQELKIIFRPVYERKKRRLYPAPASIFWFSDTIRNFTIGNCEITNQINVTLHLPQLRHLKLEEVRISAMSLYSMISGSPVLECLLIDRCFGFGCVRINSGSLKAIAVCAECKENNDTLFQELIIEDAPSLERLLHLDRISNLRVSVISAPKLESVRCIFDSSNKIQGFPFDGLQTVMRTVHTLAVKMIPLTLDIAIDLLTCFPCLETLYIESSKSGPRNFWRRKHKKLISTIDIRLKKIVYERYRDVMSEFQFITFFILNAKLLESMTIQVRSWHTEEFLAELAKKLQLEKRASTGARFHFAKDTCVCSLDIEQVCDLDIADPFMC